MTRLELLGSLATGVFHDINNQLWLIMNNSDSPDVQAACARCVELGNSVLDFGAANAGKRKRDDSRKGGDGA